MTTDFKTIYKLRDLRNIKRFSKRILHNNDTVASHSYYVGVLALLVAERYMELNKEAAVKPIDCLVIAMFHDAEESELGDLMTTTKYRTKSIADDYHQLSEQVLRDVIGNNTNVSNLMFGDIGEQEHKICDFADKFEAYLTCIEEYNLYSNKQFESIINKYKIIINGIIEKDNTLQQIYQELSLMLNEFYLGHTLNE